MCGRFTLATPPQLVADLFEMDVDDLPLFEPRYNIAPTQPIVAVRMNGSGLREGVELRWGLIPSWTKELKGSAPLINARSETAAEKPSFRSAMKRRRCLVVADGFYEWRQEGKLRQPFYIRMRDEKPLVFAGLWEQWRPPEGKTVESCSLLTTQANRLMSQLHDRMPVLLNKTDFDRWLDTEKYSVEDVQSLLVPYDPDAMELSPVSTYVNNARNEGKECLNPA